MPKVLRLDKGAEEGLQELLKFLLESRSVRGVITLTKVNESSGVAYSLVTDPKVLEDALPLFPLMPANAGKVLSRITLIEPADKPIAAVMRPCELRAFAELLKRNQGSSENFLLISPTCGGVYPLKTAVGDNIREKLPQYWDAVKKGEIPPDVRSNCTACTQFIPYTADMTIALIENGGIDKQCEIYLNTEKAEELVTGMAGEVLEQELNVAALETFRSKREAQKDKLLEEVKDLDMEKVFGKCIGCHACSKVCPACYCHLCFFDSPVSEHGALDYERELSKTGGVRVPLDTIFYHLVRLFHVSMSCVGCGQCNDVCPVNIPLGAVAVKTAGAVQEAFDYLAGKSMDEELPITTFKPDEFAGIN
ncbi:MAG: coenzyme F420 hydrogenase [Dehalococcoidia bacterium]|nr:coenzyme F420 hydrogenase [Dehalococcoidia bacterium]